MESRPQPGEFPAPPPPQPDDDLYVIHYSQERAEDCTASTPAVSAVIVEHVLTGAQRTFASLHVAEREGIPPQELPARSPALERRVLEDYFAFSAGLPRATWLHWGMRRACFGFEVLSQRARRHGLDPVEVPPERGFDLANSIKRLYGQDYAPHPRLWHACHRNRVAGPGMLSEEQAAAAWAAGRHAALLRSLSSKVHAIARLYELVRSGTFQTGGFEPPPPESSALGDSSGGLRPEGKHHPEDGHAGPCAAELAEVLRRAGRRGKALPAALVEFMAGRQSAPVEEVAGVVHGHRGCDCKRVYANMRRTNTELEGLAADFRFKQGAGYIHKVPAGTTDQMSAKCSR